MKTNFTEQDLQFYPTPKSLLTELQTLLNGTKSHQCWSQVPGKGISRIM